MAADARRRMLARSFLSRSPEATEALGAALGSELEAGAIVTLDGELGSGKTCFVRGLARGLGVIERVQSPTYALMHSYTGRLELFHFDAWMEGRERAFLLDGGLEWLSAAGVTAIEWAERVADVLPPERLSVKLAHETPTERSIEMRVVGAGRVADELARALEIVASAGGTPDLAEIAAR